MSEQLDLFSDSSKDEPDPQNALKTPSSKRTLYFDLETQKSAEEVGGWENTHCMGLAVGVVWDSCEQEYFTYQESTTKQLVKKLQTADLVVGFNVKKFDYGVLQHYTRDISLIDDIPTFDMLDYIKDKLGHRLSLNHLAENTLNAKKSADGLISLQWYKDGEIEKIVDYCKQDVKVTRDLFLYGESNGHVKYKSRGIVKELEVDWNTRNLASLF
ncbi:uncharacterized protein METZ01_LOCUS468297 [marine metagenome]|uniref:YprB ribonuclease H-like domain-containing protein n=1 Tax=marine metagenome TaxID=408172 RepID=A0A383B6J0_9ZZZZ